MKTNTKEQPSYYAILTANVRYSKVLSANEKIMFAEITALSQKTGRCYATNKYFADLYGVSTKSVSRWITNLKKEGFVNVYQIKEAYEKDGEIKYKQIRYVIANTTPPMDTDVHPPLDKNVHPPMDTDVPLITVQDINTTSKNKNTGDVFLKNSDNSNTENQTTLKEKEINPNTPQSCASPPSSPNKEEEKGIIDAVKSSEIHRKSTNGIKGKYSYKSEIESVLKRFNLISGKRQTDTDDNKKRIICFLEYIQKDMEVEKSKSVEIACEYLEDRGYEHDFSSNPNTGKKGYIEKKYYRIDSLLSKPKYKRWKKMREERENEISQKRQKLINQKPKTFFR